MISLSGNPGATSILATKLHPPSHAFALGIIGDYRPWANQASDPLPQTVWWQFYQSVIVVKFAFSSRDERLLEQSPRKFEFVASNDGTDWTVLQTYETEFTELSQEKEFLVPAEAQGPFIYYGIRTLEVTSGPQVAIKRLKMWQASMPGDHPNIT